MFPSESASLKSADLSDVLCSPNPVVIPSLDIIFYDGHCGLCHGAVKFVLRRDRTGVFRFAPLQGATFLRAVPASRQANVPDSIVALTTNGNLLVRSDALIYILRRLGGIWRVLAAIMTIVPGPLRDNIYNLIARVRYRIFGRRDGLCPLVSQQLRDRFLD
ncbi:MAG TPA: DCC1-like thiol-disulfide oxidoreductase family protein [Candidatus Acidoferrales bacterium]|nr:DCC1-like thiol-disulfide oxidoreductase family protein [Candidatus Acidoferrales bacterium]